ncbi:Protein of unknown function [Chitinophaga sp. CF118]|uniref:SdpI family protein n=1 Tax=Chitinophaga sp. CF118 TaxID=1884367 RepID=UPI0008E3303B|nr:SdpI family protein [Chitinophaga sp. CF118]SFD10697.1 Protein of unknown function [Chitinophaga sp. CF118]
MKKPDIGQELLLLMLLLLPMVYLGIIWPSLPEIIPTNFSIKGVPERVGEKSDFLLLMIFLFFTNLLLYFLFRYIPHVEEPTFSTEPLAVLQRKYYRIRFMIHIYLAVFTGAIIFMVSQGQPFVMERWVFTGVGVLIGGIGFYLKRLQPNYFIGVRTPWTLQSPEIWRQTHNMAGTLWMCSGIAMIIAGFFMPVVVGVFILIFLGAILAFLPYIYSFRLFNTDKG